MTHQSHELHEALYALNRAGVYEDSRLQEIRDNLYSYMVEKQLTTL